MKAEHTRSVQRDVLPGDEERQMLRDSARGYLKQYWPEDKALQLAQSPGEVGAIWRGLAQQGLAVLGSEPLEGGLREILVVMEELGRAACPAPMVGAALANIALRDAMGDFSAATCLLEGMHEGEASVAVAFGAYDGDANAGSAKLDGGLLTGRINFVEDAQHATHLLVLAPGPTLAIVERGAAGVSISATPGLSVPALSSVRLEKVPAAVIQLPIQLVEDLSRVARLGLVARSLGAASRSFEMVAEYAKERQQFGQPIGKFQAIQHKLADCLTALEGVRQTLNNAAINYDYGVDQWRVFASACYAYASPALRQVSLETHHTFGAIGYSEEHEAPRHFRRTHGDLARMGGPMRAREELAQYLIDEGQELPDYDLGPAGNAFRLEVRQWLAEHWTANLKPAHDALPFHERGRDREYAAGMMKQNWHAVAWPKEYGGQARSPMEQLAFMEEIQRADAPRAGRGGIQAFALMTYGTAEQKAEFLPKLRSGEINFCLGYSEPGSGSDLASLKTSAVRDGDEWVINGQKIWTTGAEKADYIWLAARTDPTAKPPHAGISVFIVPMSSPGITIQPSMALYGHTFCNEFFDNVRVPANALVGEVNGGWKVLTSALATERITMGGFVANVRANFERLLAHIRATPSLLGLAAVRDRIGALAAEIEVARQLLTTSVQMLENGKVPVHEAGMSKVFTGELMERLGEAALDICGTGVTLAEEAEGAISNGKLEQMLRQSIMVVIGGGTAEVQRNLIALRGLNLPR